ncbi:nucleotidyltransferase family protein [Rickettsia helvetica]|uniref:nucleotidyltransferase family protein n=1 Tax=Rickettsia helvetica TaxID=35789 RepID=UPI000A03EFE0|nr:nucleotidyltransferase domain-containing protein [Rickettsia helvetica]
MWLFGSRARGDNDERSDIDIAIICPNITDQEWLEAMDIIENADTLLKIDCVRFESTKISSELYENILKEKKIIYVKNKP